MSKPLESLVKKLAETLETNPDPWFNDPCGWLYKPNFKREAQERASVIEHSTHQTKPFSWKRMVTGSPYKKRWFKLDIKKRQLKYYKSADDQEMIGELDMGTIVDVTFSKLYDAPEFALDLMTIQKHYTLAAESHSMMVKWAYAFKLAMASRSGNSKRDSAAVTSKASASPSDKWLRYDFTYTDPGPLYLNVMGACHRDRVGKVLKNSIVVISFEPDKDGNPGRSEKSGVISVGDYLIGYNGIDMTEYTFNDAVDTIISAPFPKTLNFLRDTEKVRVANRKEGWAFVYYPALTKHRRRYLEIRDNLIHFHKPAPGGSALSERDAFFELRHVLRVKPVHDKSMSRDMQYMLRLICSDKAVIEHVNEDDQSIGTTKVSVLDLCFTKEQSMNSWRSVLVSPGSASITADPLEIIEISQSLANASIANLGLKSSITNKFNPREFRLSEGFLRWKRPPSKKMTSISTKERSLFLANSSGCDVRTVRAIEDLTIPKGQGYRYQLAITAVDINYDTGASTTTSIVMGMEDESTALQWLQMIRDCVSLAPSELVSMVAISTTIEKVDTSSTAASTYGNDDDGDNDMVDVFASDERDADDNHDDEHEIIQGYLYKRLERPGTGGSKAEYVKRWFSLKDHSLTCYKSSSESRGHAFALEYINIHQALAVHEASEILAPDNSFEVVLPSITMLFVAEDEEEMMNWLEAIGDILEAREQVVPVDASENDSKSRSENSKTRIGKLQDAVMFSGELQMKRFNRLTQKMVWRDRFIVIAAGSVYYYEAQEDFFDENKTCTGEIPVVAIHTVESVYESKIKNGCGFAIQARVVEGGDTNGFRTYVFEAKTPDIARQWMEQICKATGELELEAKEGEPGYISTRIADTARFNEKMKAIMTSKSMRVDTNSTGGAEGNPDTSPAGMRRSPLDRRTSLAGRSGRGFSRAGSIIVSQEAQQQFEAAMASTKADLEPIAESEDQTNSLDKPARRGSSMLDGPGGGGGRGRGLGIAAMTPVAAMKRQSMSRRSMGEGRSTTPVPNESV